MEKKKFEIDLNAAPEKVWDILWKDSTYRIWTSPFSEGSHAVTDWKEGSKVLFLDGQGSGMVSTIAANKPNEFMSFKHLGEISDGVEDLESERVKSWAGSLENYLLKKKDSGKTHLVVELDVNEESKDYFDDMWSKALEKIKELAE